MPPARILLVSHQPDCGGAEHSLLDLIRGLDRARFEPWVVTSAEGTLAAGARQLGATVRLVRLRGRWPGKLFGLWRAARALAELARASSACLLHANTIIAGWVGVAAARQAGIPCLWHVRDLTYPRLARAACGLADRVIANSGATAACFPRRWLDQGRLSIVPNGVGDAFFAARDSPTAVKQELGLPANARLVGIAGRIDPAKGHLDLLRAWPEVVARHPDAVLLVIGSVLFGAASRRLRAHGAAVERLSRAAPGVRLLGQRQDLPRLFAALDLLVHPSCGPEAFGRAIAEAQAAGKPVVATRLGGIPELIEDGVTGLLVEPRSRMLAARICELLDAPARASALGAAARIRVRQRCTVERHARSIQELWEQTLSGGTARSAPSPSSAQSSPASASSSSRVLGLR